MQFVDSYSKRASNDTNVRQHWVGNIDLLQTILEINCLNGYFIVNNSLFHHCLD